MRETVKDKTVLAAMDKTIRKIEERAKWFGYLETMFFGLSLGLLGLVDLDVALHHAVRQHPDHRLPVLPGQRGHLHWQPHTHTHKTLWFNRPA